MPLASFCWKEGRVEMMRQRVETTTNRQDTTATTCISGHTAISCQTNRKRQKENFEQSNKPWLFQE
jgi:hypothetical protein